MKKSLVISWLALLLSSCYSGSQDDDLHMVPVTNNPRLITDPNRNTSFTGMGI